MHEIYHEIYATVKYLIIGVSVSPLSVSESGQLFQNNEPIYRKYQKIKTVGEIPPCYLFKVGKGVMFSISHAFCTVYPCLKPHK